MKETAVDIRTETARREDSTVREEETIRTVTARAEITRADVALTTETDRIITVFRDRTTVRTVEMEAVASMATETARTETIRADAALITTETV